MDMVGQVIEQRAGIPAAPSAAASSSLYRAIAQTVLLLLAGSALPHGTPVARLDKGPPSTSSHLPSPNGSKATGGRLLRRPRPGHSRRSRGLICHRRSQKGVYTTTEQDPPVDRPAWLSEENLNTLNDETKEDLGIMEDSKKEETDILS